LKDQYRVDHESALAMRDLQREIDELKKRLEVIGCNKKVNRKTKNGFHIENKIVGCYKKNQQKRRNCLDGEHETSNDRRNE